jgi:hypothetical protein
MKATYPEAPVGPRESLHFIRALLGVLTIFLAVFSLAPVWAQEASTGASDAPAAIETHWDSLWGMKYLQNGTELSESRLKGLLDSSGDPQISALMAESESDKTLGTLSLGGSVVGSAVCLVIPGTVIHLGSLKISAPYLPLQIPSLALGVLAAFLENAGGSAKYSAVQRYNRQAMKPSPLSWNLDPEARGMSLNYVF